ncbi:MAG: GNAT family N-acetyltransferase [Hyphomicrobiales bacterium]
MRTNELRHEIAVFSSFDEVADRWTALEQRGLHTPFQTLPWCRTLMEKVGGGAEPVLVVVTDRDGRDLMLLPLVRRQRNRLMVIEFIDFGYSDYNAPLLGTPHAIDADYMKTLWQAILEALPAADTLHLDKQPEQIGGVANPLVGLVGSRPVKLMSHGVALPEKWADFHEVVLSKRTAKSIRQQGRRLARAGKVTFIHSREGEKAAEQLFDGLVELRIARFAKLGRDEPLLDDGVRSFYRSMVSAGKAMMMGIKVDGEIIAVLYGLVEGRSFSLLILAMASGDWEKYSPGLVMVESGMAHLHKTGFRYFDFTIGGERYKRQFGADDRTLFEVRRSLSFRGLPDAVLQNLRYSASRNATARQLVDAYRNLVASLTRKPDGDAEVSEAHTDQAA